MAQNLDPMLRPETLSLYAFSYLRVDLGQGKPAASTAAMTNVWPVFCRKRYSAIASSSRRQIFEVVFLANVGRSRCESCVCLRKTSSGEVIKVRRIRVDLGGEEMWQRRAEMTVGWSVQKSRLKGTQHV